MAGNFIDEMIENFASSVRQTTDTSKQDNGELTGFSLTGKTYTKDDKGAAEMLRDKAIKGWKSAFPKSRKEPRAWAWSSFVKEHLGISRIGSKRFDEILKIAGLTVSESDTLVVLEQEEKETHWAEEVSEEEITEEQVIEEDDEPAPPNPMKSKGPETFECGHTNWYTQEENEKAREQGFCCAGRVKKGSIDWSVRGLYHPVPEALRKGHDRFNSISSMAWQGYCCCPHTGLYIGGIGNDCRSNKDDKRCVIHGGK